MAHLYDCDEALSLTRMLVKDHYGQADMLFLFISYSTKLKILNMNLGAIYTCKVSMRFYCEPPVLEVWAA